MVIFFLPPGDQQHQQNKIKVKNTNKSKIMRRTISILLVFNLWISLSAANSYRLDTSDVENLNKQIKTELEASTFYMAAFHYFERSDMALPGVAKFFHKMSSEEKGHADKLMTYMNMRQSPPKTPSVTISDICKQFKNEDICKNIHSDDCKYLFSTEGDGCKSSCPPKDDSCNLITPEKVCNVLTGKHEFSIKCKNDNLPLFVMILTYQLEHLVYNELVNIVNETADEELKHFIEHEFLDEQIESIKQISDYRIQMARMGCGLGFYIFDQQLLQNDAKS